MYGYFIFLVIILFLLYSPQPIKQIPYDVNQEVLNDEHELITHNYDYSPDIILKKNSFNDYNSHLYNLYKIKNRLHVNDPEFAIKNKCVRNLI